MSRVWQDFFRVRHDSEVSSLGVARAGQPIDSHRPSRPSGLGGFAASVGPFCRFLIISWAKPGRFGGDIDRGCLRPSPMLAGGAGPIAEFRARNAAHHRDAKQRRGFMPMLDGSFIPQPLPRSRRERRSTFAVHRLLPIGGPAPATSRGATRPQRAPPVASAC